MRCSARASLCALVAGAIGTWIAGFAAAQPRVRHVDVLRSEAPPPEIDGVLEDPIWEGPPTLDDFHQVFPDYGAPASERTEVWLRRDAKALYIGVRMHDRRPDLILARQLTRDGLMSDDDRINIMLDTFNNRREAFFFQTNALGTRAEASTEQGGLPRIEWDTIWYCATTRDAGGWTAEIAIPFQSLPLDPDSDTWGFELERAIRRHNERARWANWSQNHIISDPGNLGELGGLRGVEAVVLDVKPSLSISHAVDRTGRVDSGPAAGRTSSDTDQRGRPSLDVFYRPLPSVTASLTVNPDFSDAPVDLRQNNLTRFESFFPETRDFFLEDLAIFRFADLQQNGRPFYSRRIGLVDERVIDIDAGLKLTGHVGHVEFGALQVQTASEPFRSCKAAPTPAELRACQAQILPSRPAIDGQSLSVGRAKWNLGQESWAGVIFTGGDPRDEIDNNLIGADLVYRNSHLPRGGRFGATGWAMRTSSGNARGTAPTRAARGDEYAFGTRLEYPTDRINTWFSFSEFQENFDPRLGYVNRLALRDPYGGVIYRDRVGVRDYGAYLRYRTRFAHGPIRTLDHGASAHIVTDLDNSLESQELSLNLVEVASPVGDGLRLAYLINQERPRQAPFIDRDAFILAGDYAFQQLQVLLESSGTRPVKGRLELTRGEYYDGRITRAVAGLELRPGPHLFVSLEWDQADVRLSERGVVLCVPGTLGCEPSFPANCASTPGCHIFPGDFTKRLLRLRFDVAFTTEVGWVNTLQYDNGTDTTSLNSRLRWEPTPGREIFLVINQGWESDVETIAPSTSQLTAKLGWTFRY